MDKSLEFHNETSNLEYNFYECLNIFLKMYTYKLIDNTSIATLRDSN